jgi:hypothetical protein
MDHTTESKSDIIAEESGVGVANEMKNEPESLQALPPTDIPLLPLGWTQVKRKRSTKNSDGKNNDGEETDEMDICCDDPSCPRPSQRPRMSNLDANINNSETQTTTYRGHAIFCLHDINPSWVQGYFLTKESKKPWGLLAVLEDIDECLQCVDGGYRRVTITVFPFSNAHKKESYKNVDWTGGDMMRLNGEKVNMEPDKLYTGKKAISHVEKYFRHLLQKLRNEETEEGETKSTVLDFLPNVAVVTGPMSLVLSAREKEDHV